MTGFQVIEALNRIPETRRLFRGFYFNGHLPLNLLNERTCFCVVNAITDTESNMGHSILFYVKDYHLLFFDSSASEPNSYGWDIQQFYQQYPGDKSIVLSRPLQNESSYVCGAYTVVIAYFLSNNFTVEQIKSLFTENTRNNDLIISKYFALIFKS